MAEHVEFADGGTGKIRSFWVGLLLVIVTLGIYYWFWYYLVNDELKDIGVSRNDQKLAGESPGLSVTAVLIGGIIVIPALISIYNYGARIQRAQGILGVPQGDRISPVLAFLLYFPGCFLIVPVFIHYWYVTKHQDIAVRAAGREATRMAVAGAVDPATVGVFE